MPGPKATATQQHITPKPRFIVTGFGRFCGVAQNPTEQLVTWLAEKGCNTAATAQEQEQQPYCISSLDVLEVSADAVDAFMQKQQHAILQAASSGTGTEGPQPVVLLHFGVDTQVRRSCLVWHGASTNPFVVCPGSCWQLHVKVVRLASRSAVCLPAAHMLHVGSALHSTSCQQSSMPADSATSHSLLPLLLPQPPRACFPPCLCTCLPDCVPATL